MASATIRQLAAAVGAQIIGDPDVAVTAVTHDSTKVKPGTLFCCVAGANVDGHTFAGQAVASGAAALLVSGEFLVADVDPSIPRLVVADPRAAMGPLAAAFWSQPSSELAVVGVTGTNGKTTVVTIIQQVLAVIGVQCGVIGTLTGARTTPESPDLQAQLRSFVDSGSTVVAMEVSSHALALHRVDGTRFAVAVFTNLGSDHLDFHQTPERYFDAKALLFDEKLSVVGVTNFDDVHGRLLRDASSIPMTTYSIGDLSDLVVGRNGSTFVWRGQRVELALSGRFNISNALAAAEAVVQLGHEPAAIAHALSSIAAPPGRFETVDCGQPFAVIVDYAHTPDALENLLVTADELVDGGRLKVVFGCGGDRDASKRPMMGRVASEHADEVTITSDNPRSEEPATIIAAVNAGSRSGGRARSVATEIDRRLAIDSVIASAEAGDVVVIAGKGHETTQTIGSEVLAFDDRLVAARALNASGWTDA